jgi:hypothetical protein
MVVWVQAMAPSLRIGGLGILMKLGSNFDGNDNEMIEGNDDGMSEGGRGKLRGKMRRSRVRQTRSISRGNVLSIDEVDAFENDLATLLIFDESLEGTAKGEAEKWPALRGTIRLRQMSRMKLFPRSCVKLQDIC